MSYEKDLTDAQRCGDEWTPAEVGAFLFWCIFVAGSYLTGFEPFGQALIYAALGYVLGRSLWRPAGRSEQPPRRQGRFLTARELLEEERRN